MANVNLAVRPGKLLAGSSVAYSKLWGQRLYIVVWPSKLLADSYCFIFFIYFNKIYIKSCVIIITHTHHLIRAVTFLASWTGSDLVGSVKD